MWKFICSIVGLLLGTPSAAVVAQGSSSLRPDPAISCPDCEAWNAPQPAFKIFGNTYYVGVAGLSSVLIASDAGLILIDGGLPQSAPLIDANIRSLGFRTEDVRLIVISHEHYDHVAGVAALQRVSGAVVSTSERAARALAAGKPSADDPQSRTAGFPPVKNVQAIADGEVLRVAPLSITGHFTPGHTPGAMTWSWQSCEPAGPKPRCLNMVYADSLNPVSDEGFRYTSRPGVIDAFRKAIDTLEKLPCDVLLASHPAAVDLAGKLARWQKDPSVNPFVDSSACRAHAATARKRLEARVAQELKK